MVDTKKQIESELQMSPPSTPTESRVIAGKPVSSVLCNGKAQFIYGACEPTNNRVCPKTSYQEELEKKADEFLVKFAKDREKLVENQIIDDEWDDSPGVRALKQTNESLKTYEPYELFKHYGVEYGYDKEDTRKLYFMSRRDEQVKDWGLGEMAANKNCLEKQSISKDKPLTDSQNSAVDSERNMALMSLGAMFLPVRGGGGRGGRGWLGGGRIARARGWGGSRGMPGAKGPASGAGRPAADTPPSPKVPPPSKAPTEPAVEYVLQKPSKPVEQNTSSQIKPTVSEPVSVANGEYLETWRDFLIPGVLPFDGSRYMGLKLPDAERWRGPLGPCQISAFDEYFSNLNRGEVVFHQADGKAIAFKRPFNFLPSQNAAYPHLELKAPWLGRLVLKDRNIKKVFFQYEDKFYRLGWIEDLNGNRITLHRDTRGVLTWAERSDGLKLIFDNDAQGRRTGIMLLGFEDSAKQVLARYAYDTRGRMISADCAFGMSVRYEWQAKKPLLLRWHNLTKRSETVFTYDAEGRVIHTATSGIWNDDRFVYDSEKRETRYLPAGDEARAQSFAYDEYENITAEVDALGGTVAHRYNQAGFRIATTDANGHSTKTVYDIFGNVKKFTDAEGRRTTYGWGPDGQLDIVIDNLGNKKQYKHDDNSNVILEIDAKGQRTAFERDEHGRIVRTVFADGTEEKRVYASNGWLDRIVDAKGGVTKFIYDPFGRVVESINPLGEKTAFTYAAGAGGFDVPTALRRPDGVVVRRAFDQEGALASVTDGEGRTWTYRHGAFDILEEIGDPRGGVLKLGYDSEGNFTSVTNAMNRVYHLRRDVAGRIVEEQDFDGRVTRYKRDAGGRVTEKIKPDGARLTYAYDKTGLVTRVEAWEAGAPEASEVVRYWYDGRGLLQTAQNRFARVDYIRDKMGRVIEEDCNGRRIKVVYDACGRRLSRRVFSGIDQPNETRLAEHLVEYVRDPLGAVAKLVLNGHEPLSFTRDALGRETRRESAGGFKLDSTYDAAGQLMQQEAGRSLGHSYDDLRRAQLQGLSPQAQRQVDRSYGWDKAFAPTSIKDGIWGEMAFSYDRNGQVSEAKFGNGTGEKFAYDAAHNVTGVQAIESNAALGDGLGRFLNWTSSPGGAVQVACGPKGEKITLHHDVCGRVIERIVEQNGFRPKRWRYEWDVFDRLIVCLTPDNERWVYTYDPFGRRISKVRKFTEPELAWLQQKFPHVLEGRELPVDRGAWQIEAQRPKNVAAIDNRPPIVGTWYSWDGDVLCEEAPLRLDGKVDWVLATRWHFEEGTFKPLAKENMGGELSYIVTDHLGTPREMFSESGFLQWAASFTTWGVVRGVKVPVPEAANDDALSGPGGIGSSGPRVHGNLALKPAPEEAIYDCPIRFQGQWQDEETGLYYNRHRHYDPLIAQYMSLDPIGLAGGDRPSGYVTNPTIWNDPLGLAATANTDTVPMFRVQGGTPPTASRELIKLDSANNPIIKDTTLNISMGDPAHAAHFLTKRPGAVIVKFEIPKWLADFIKSNAIKQQGYKSNPANQGGLAPKIVDPTTPGQSFELPSPWGKWLQENAVPGSGRIIGQ